MTEKNDHSEATPAATVAGPESPQTKTPSSPEEKQPSLQARPNRIALESREGKESKTLDLERITDSGDTSD